MIELDMATLTLISGAVLPLLISVLVKANVDRRVKVYLNVALSMLTGGAAFLVTNNGTGRWQEVVNAMILAYLASNVSYMGTYKPSGITEGINQATANVGIGKPHPPATDMDAPATATGPLPPVSLE